MEAKIISGQGSFNVGLTNTTTSEVEGITPLGALILACTTKS